MSECECQRLLQVVSIDMKVKNRVEGLYEAEDNFKEWNCNFGSEQARDVILVSNQMFLGMGNHLGPFSGASYQPEGQEKGFKCALEPEG